MTVILWALDRVRGRALGWLGPGSPKSQPHQALRGVSKPTPGLASKPVGNGRWYVIPRFRDGHDPKMVNNTGQNIIKCFLNVRQNI